MAYEKAAVRHARMVSEAREQREQQDRAQVAEVVAEFGGDTARMAEEILYWRRRVKRLAETVGRIERQEPFALLAVGPYWKPGEREPGWWR
jgi:hypothetical protein